MWGTRINTHAHHPTETMRTHIPQRKQVHKKIARAMQGNPERCECTSLNGNKCAWAPRQQKMFYKSGALIIVIIITIITIIFISCRQLHLLSSQMLIFIVKVSFSKFMYMYVNIVMLFIIFRDY